MQGKYILYQMCAYGAVYPLHYLLSQYTRLNVISRLVVIIHTQSFQDRKVHGANMGPTWVLSATDGTHVGPMNLALRVVYG